MRGRSVRPGSNAVVHQAPIDQAGPEIAAAVSHRDRLSLNACESRGNAFCAESAQPASLLSFRISPSFSLTTSCGAHTPSLVSCSLCSLSPRYVNPFSRNPPSSFPYRRSVSLDQSSTGAASGSGSGGVSTTAPAQTNSGSTTAASGSNQASGSGNSTAAASPSITVMTSVFTTVALGSNRVLSTITSTQLITSTIQPAGNGSSGGSSPTSASSSSSLPPPTTAPVSIDGGASISGGAPSPGASGAGGVYGPDDGYTAAALAHHVNLALVALSGVVAGAALVVM